MARWHNFFKRQPKTTMKRVYLLMLSAFFTLIAGAQDGGGADIKVDINKGGESAGWYTNPIVWVVGAAVFILLLVALLRGRRD
jgi:hypothetical protein